MSMEQWWNDTHRGKNEVLGEKHYKVWVVDGFMSMEQWWNDTERGKTEVLGEKHYKVWVVSR